MLVARIINLGSTCGCTALSLMNRDQLYTAISYIFQVNVLYSTVGSIIIWHNSQLAKVTGALQKINFQSR